MQKFKVERQILKLVGATIRTFDENQQLLCRADQKAFKLKEQIYFYADEAKNSPVFSLKARQIIDVAATYDIFGADGETVIASFRRQGVSSIFIRDHWLIMDPNGQQIGEIREDTQLLGLLRRFVDLVALVAPPKYSIVAGETEVGTLQMNYNPLTLRYTGEYSDQAEQMLSKEILLAAPNLLAIIERK